jgi:hypothetical protein
MCSYEFTKTLTLHYVQGCKNKMITVCMYVCMYTHVHMYTHSIHMTDIHRVKMTLCGHKLMK